MGHFSHSCKLSGLPITGGTPVVLIPMVISGSMYDNSEESLKKFGKTYLCSNEGTRMKFIPNMFPIMGDYDEYGGMENIIEDDNTRALEEYYGLTIQQIVNILTSGRKDDGYDESLKVIKKKREIPADYIKGEYHETRYSRLTGDERPSTEGGVNDAWREWRTRYEEWAKTNPDYDREYGYIDYEEKYMPLIESSGMWVHRDVYMQLTDSKINDSWSKLDLGTPALLESLGFVRLEEKSKDERYKIQFKKGDLIVNSDGTWINVPKRHIYRLKEFAEYCAEMGESIDISEHVGKDYMEQIFDYVVPTYETIGKMMGKSSIPPERLAKYKELFQKEGDENPFTDEQIIEMLCTVSSHTDRMGENIRYYFLNTDRYGSSRLKNPMTEVYFDKAKEGQLRDNLIRFWRFDKYMYACGYFYDVVGTGPQDGEHELVLKVLDVAKSILEKELKERKERWGDDYDEDEDE